MKSRKDARLRLWMALALVPGVGPVRQQKLLNRFTITELFELAKEQLSQLGFNSQQVHRIQAPDYDYIDRVIDYCQHNAITPVCFEDDNYPPLLKQLSDPPCLLFCRGNSELLRQPQLAIVGTRRPTFQGRELAFEFAQALAKYKLVITSGLALGIDSQSHKGALSVNGGTVAVLGTGVDVAYPRRHASLYQDIIAHSGCVVSEMLPGTPAIAHNFPRRNRIISGLSLGTLVIEATLDSGSLITARCACEQNREVFALPGAIYNEQARGCHALIQQGAKLVQEVTDIIDELPFYPPVVTGNEEAKKSGNESLYSDQLLASVDFEVTTIDKVVVRSKLPVEVVVARLIKMELQGLIKSVSGGYVRLRRG